MAYLIIFFCAISILFYSYKFNKTASIISLLPLFYNFVVLYVILGSLFFTYGIDAPFDLYTLLSSDDLYKGSLPFMVSAFFFYIGGALVRNNRIKNRSDLFNLEIKYQKALIFFILLVYFVYVLGYGAEQLIYRRGYIDENYERNKTILVMFLVISPLVTSLIPFIKNKFSKYMVFSICYLIIFSTSSRFIVMLPFLYVIGTFLRFSKVKIRILLICMGLVFFGLIFVLQIRYYPFHGLIPNLDALFTKGLDLEYLSRGLNYAFSFSLFGVSYVLKNFTHDDMAFFISLNPLPSLFLNLDYMLQAQRMIGTSPMSAIATLSLAGYSWLISFYFLTGYCFSYIFIRMKGSTFLYYAVLGLFIIFTLFSIQYNLRGLSRFFYYSILIFIFHIAFKKINIIKRDGNEYTANR